MTRKPYKTKCGLYGVTKDGRVTRDEQHIWVRPLEPLEAGTRSSRGAAAKSKRKAA